MIPTKRFIFAMIWAILALTLLYMSVTHAAEPAQPGAKWSAPAAVVVQTCGLVNSVILTREDGSLEPFDYTAMTTESLRLYLNRVGQVIIVNAPCS